MLPLLSTNGTIVPEPVNCYPRSTQGSQWMFRQALSPGWDRGLLWWYKTILDKYMTFKPKRQKQMLEILCPFCTTRKLFAIVAPFKEVFRSIWVDKKGYKAVMWKSHCCLSGWIYVKITHMVFISPSEKHSDLPGSAIHKKTELHSLALPNDR